MSIIETARIFTFFWAREMRVLSDSWPSVMGSSLTYSCLLALVVGYFMPAMGMPESLCVPVFLGSFFLTALSVCYTCCIEWAYDLRSPKLVGYYYSLPTSFSVITVALITTFMLRILVIATPLLLIGLCLLGQWHVFVVAWPQAIVLFFLAIQYFALLFLSLAYACPLNMLLGDIWPRFLSPMFALGCMYYPWRVASEMCPIVARFMLLNPAVYCSEGFKGALLGGEGYLSTPLCIAVLCVVNFILFYFFRRAIVRAINPVVGRTYGNA